MAMRGDGNQADTEAFIGIGLAWRRYASRAIQNIAAGTFERLTDGLPAESLINGQLRYPLRYKTLGGF